MNGPKTRFHQERHSMSREVVKSLEFEGVKTDGRSGNRGLQLPKNVSFEEWEVGGKYVKSIFIYNSSAKVQRFLYDVPKCAAFVMDLPKPIKLYTRTGVKLTICFQPKEKRDYNDKLFIRTADNERLIVKLQAMATKAFIAAPHELTLGMCGVSQTIEKTLIIYNNSRTDLEIEWQVLQPFTIEPRTAAIATNKKLTATVIFTPRKAATYKCKAVCTPRNLPKSRKDYHVLTLTAQGVYPYLSVMHDNSANCPHEYQFAFGDISVNSVATKEITLVNPIPIKSQFVLNRSKVHLSTKSPFSFDKFSGEIPPSGKYVLKALFSPTMPHSEDCDVWFINVSGGFSTKVIAMSGKSIGPSVTLSAYNINFQEIERGMTIQKAIKMTNSSPVKTLFQFEIDSNESVFKFEPSYGQLSKNSTLVVQIYFRPPYPVTYYRRVACVVHMQNPLYINLIGTAVSSEVQPERLEVWHLDIFWLQIRKGQFFFKDDNNILPVATPKPQPTPIDEYLYDGYHSDFTLVSPPASLDQNVIDFGKCNLSYVPTRVFSLTNHTYFVLTITWIGGPTHVFSIKPQIVDIQPHRTAVFHLTFKPTAINHIYSAELEGYAHCTGTGNLALSPGDFNWPPWCLTLTTMGHTHATEREIYRANFELSNYRIQLPPVPIKSHAARTMLITNKSPTTQLVYNMITADEELVVKPRIGVIVNPYRIITIGLTPRFPGPFSSCVFLETNFDKLSHEELTIQGFACQPILSFDYSYGLYFKPSCVGVTTDRTILVYNTSPIIIQFNWSVKPIYQQLLTVQPLKGSISPNGIQRFRFNFCPQKKTRYMFSVSLTATSEGSFGTIIQKQQELTISGEGVAVCLKADPADMDIGALIVGTLKTENLNLINLSYCNLYIKLSIDEKTTCPSCSGLDEKSKKHCLRFGHTENDYCFHLPARCKQTIDFKVLPRKHGKYKYTVYYELLASDEGPILTIPAHLCVIRMQGAHPILQVVEARFLGSATKVRRDRAWELLSLEDLNTFLASEPNFDSRTTGVDENLYPLIDSMQPVTKNVKKVDFHLPPASYGSPPCTLIILLKNTGQVDCTWHILYPWEQNVEVAIWAHAGLYMKKEIDEGRMKDDKLIQIQPKKGRLAPGEMQFLSIVYIHQYPSHNVLPVRFSLHSGVDVIVNICAETFEKDVARVYLPFTVHQFQPICYGYSEGVVLSYNIPNHSDAALKLRLDVLPLKRFQKLHYSHPLIDCLTRRLIVQPGEYLSILWQVWPLEARTYQVDIPIKFDSDSYIRTLTLVTPVVSKPQSIPDTMKPSMALPTQPAILSHDRISFGHVPVCSRLTRILFIDNNSIFPIKFEWFMPYKLLRQRIIFEPKTGRILPNCSCMCKLSILTGHTPALYDIYCHAEVVAIKSSQSTPRPKQHARTSVQVNISSTAVLKNKMATVEGAMGSDPCEPFHVHLELKGETHMLRDFWLFFPEEIEKHFIQRPRVRPHKDERLTPRKAQIPLQVEMEVETREIVFETITTMLYDALADPDFSKIVDVIGKDPIPYYYQIHESDFLTESNQKSSSASLPSFSLHSSVSSMSIDSFEATYWTHSKILGRQKSLTKPPPITASNDIFHDSYVASEMKTFPETMSAIHFIFESMILAVIEEADKREFNLFARPRFPSNFPS